MKITILGLFMILSFKTFAQISEQGRGSDLKVYCQADPTGELYSEIIDSDIVDGFESVGLDSKQYQKIIDSNPNLDFFELADKTSQSHPEIANALKIWKLEICITRGYRMLTGKL